MNQDSQDLNALIERIGESYFRERFNIQIEHASKIFSQGRRMFHIENVEWLMVFVYYNLQFTGLYDRGVSILNNAHCPARSSTTPGITTRCKGTPPLAPDRSCGVHFNCPPEVTLHRLRRVKGKTTPA